MTTEQQDWPLPAKTPELYELVQRVSKGDQRDSWYEETIISIHSTQLGAYKAGLKPSLVVRPLKVKD
jgi:hypothetical protein